MSTNEINELKQYNQELIEQNLKYAKSDLPVTAKDLKIALLEFKEELHKEFKPIWKKLNSLSIKVNIMMAIGSTILIGIAKILVDNFLTK